MKIFLIRPPVYTWPIIDREEDNFLTPLALIYLAAAIREKNAAEVKIIDCPSMKIGYKSLEKLLKKEQPDIVGITSSETIYINEVAKTAALARKCIPNVTLIAGGCHVSETDIEAITLYDFDIIVRYEGEVTIVEILEEMKKNKPDFSKILGITYRTENKIYQNKLRPLIQNLDDLPDPKLGYDLLDMTKYSKGHFWEGITLQASRGCVGNCKFCSCWIHMGEHVQENGEHKVFPKYRQKSVKVIVDEIEYFYNVHNRNYFFFIDDCFNVNSKWNKEFAEEILKRNLKIQFAAFLRNDFIVRDEKLGIFEKMAQAGLVHALTGVERGSDTELDFLGKLRTNYTADITKESFLLMKDKYPQILRQACLVVALPNDTKQSYKELTDYVLYEIDADFVAPQCLAPQPGTNFYYEEIDLVKNRDYAEFNWIYPIFSSEKLSRQEQFDEVINIQQKQALRPKHILKMFSKHKAQRGIHIQFYKTALRMFINAILKGHNPFRPTTYDYCMRKPDWYDK